MTDITATKRPRPGRRFEPVAERDLESSALLAVQALPGARAGLMLIQEVAGPFGVADFVAVVGSNDRLRERVALGVPPLLNEIDAGIVAAASPKRGRNVASIAERLGWPLSTVERRLPALLKSGAVRELRPGRFVRPEPLVPIGRLYAVETKIRDWRRALKQARTYRLWCDNYVIVMPALSTSSLVEAHAAVDEDDGGLFVAERWLRRPRLRRSDPARRLWGSEYIVAAVQGSALPALGGGEAAQPRQ